MTATKHDIVKVLNTLVEGMAAFNKRIEGLEANGTRKAALAPTPTPERLSVKIENFKGTPCVVLTNGDGRPQFFGPAACRLILKAVGDKVAMDAIKANAK